MHDCRTLESRLVDLVFGELERDETLRLLAEVETCAGCLGEYRSMTGTLLVFDQAIEASTPDESYWPRHRAMLRQRLEQLSPPLTTATRREPLWKRFFTARLPVPVPVAACLALALLASSVLALRPSAKEATTAMQPPIVIQAPPNLIEVPVLHEKVVTRTVYVEKKGHAKNEARRQSPAKRSETALTARHAERESAEGGFFTRLNLTDYQPPDEMRIRIIKRNNSDEN